MFGLNYPGDDIFQETLKSLKCPMPLWKIKTMLLGSIAAKRMVMPSHFMTMIWQGKRPVYKSLEQAQEFSKTLMGLWNELAELQDGGRYPLWLVKGEKDKQGFAVYLKIRRDEIIGFYKGLDAGATDPDEMTTEGLRALAVLGQADGFLEAYEKLISKEANEYEMVKAIDHMPSLDQMIQDSFGIIASEQKALRGKRIRDGRNLNPVRSQEKFSRNDPCPCGSGKKYKKCCWK